MTNDSTEPSPLPVRPPVLLVAVDRLPAWILPVYGSAWVAMPALDTLAAQGLVLDRMIVPGDDPHRTLAELLGGGPRWFDGLPARLAASGGATALVTDDATLAGPRPTGSDGAGGIDLHHVALQPADEPAADEHGTHVARLCDAASSVIERRQHDLVILHVSSLGHIWDAPAAFRDAYVEPEDPPAYPLTVVPDFETDADTDPDQLVAIRQAFAGQLTLLDRCLGTVLAAAASRPLGPGTVLLAGLRGMPLGLHGRVGTSTAVPFGELVHGPAILVDHRGRMAAQRFGGLVVPADLGATLEDLLGLAPVGPGPVNPPAWAGTSLEPLLDRWQPRHRDRVVVTTPHGTAIVTDDWHALTRPESLHERPMVFAKPDDYFELADVASRCPEQADRFGRLLAAAMAGDAVMAWSGPLAADSGS